MKNKRILELCLSPDAGGLELYMLRASEYLADKHDVTCIINANGKLKEHFKETDLNYFEVKRPSFFETFIIASKIAKIIDDNKIDVLHFHWTKDILTAVLAKKISKNRPKLVQSRHMTMTRFKDDFYHKFLYKNIDQILAVTLQVKEQLQKFIPSSIQPRIDLLYPGTIIPEPIASQEVQTYKEEYKLGDSFIVSIVGRIEEAKGQHILVKAVETLLKQGLNIKIVIIGHAMSEEYLKNFKSDIEKRNMTESVVFTGFTNKVHSLMQLSDSLVLATKKETFGLVLIEAMASNIAVIASNNGGPLEIVDNEKTGLHFESDSYEDLAKKIKLLFNEEFKKEIATAGREKVLKVFNSNKQFTKLYELLVN
ncbi:glycosyltransferase [Sulfurimonas aquatica]|uniref:Glycosyltransferase n=1 Tax=Sulfurimonas aquatica TaxID=2672570 RepID=A0A975AZ94_9BACT|nr:glycosyltransferase family 4 protein [Sulfurimonas aquatica]QSZ41329.1 glycosyltransferase [Sulfurimonas aquatica]